MRNALEVMQEMRRWWDSASPLPRTLDNAMKIGITWMYNSTYPAYSKMTQESSKIAHFRQLFTVWKAVAQRLPDHFADVAPTWPEYNVVVKAFPAYLEKTVPDLFPALLANRVFLGVTFTAEETARHAELLRAFTRQPVDRATRNAGAALARRY